MNPKSLSGYETASVRGKRFKVNVLNHLATDALYIEKRTVQEVITLTI
jgi:hypothetical protein